MLLYGDTDATQQAAEVTVAAGTVTQQATQDGGLVTQLLTATLKYEYAY